MHKKLYSAGDLSTSEISEPERYEIPGLRSKAFRGDSHSESERHFLPGTVK